MSDDVATIDGKVEICANCGACACIFCQMRATRINLNGKCRMCKRPLEVVQHVRGE